jgi:hypothetical protein
MPNANAIVDQLKVLGLRHGEKAGVAIASTVFLVCVGMAASQKTIDTTPDQVKKAAQQSQSNLERREDRDTILKKLEEKGIKDTSFAVLVGDQIKTALVPDNYKAQREWVTPEPGAGLIRDTPLLIAASELYAYPGRGGILLYELDDAGNRKPDTDDGKTKAPPRRRRRRRTNAGGAMGGMGMMGGMGGGAQRKKKARKSAADIAREEKDAADRKERRIKGSLAGKDEPVDPNTNEEQTAQGEKFKESVVGRRWVALTGVLDHGKMIANYREALKNPAVAHPNYRRLDMQRQTLLPDGTWTKWEFVSAKENYKVLDQLPEEDEELAPPTVLPEGLVDHLPFLLAGLYEKVHIASLVPKEKKEVPKEKVAQGGFGGRGMMGGGMMGDPNDYSKMMQNSGGANSGNMMERMRGAMGGAMGGGMMGGMGGGTESAGNYWKSTEKRVMIRGLDYTVEPDTTYRYRVRIVVWNPNYKREDVNHGVDTKAEELRGPWSAETDPVTMPPDVMPYATATQAPDATSAVKVRFEIIRFHPEDGATVPKNFWVQPGEVVGSPRSADVPVSDGTGKKAKVIDFNSRQIVLDVYINKKSTPFGYQHLPPGFVGSLIPRPTVALLLRKDGSVVVHREAEDEDNDVRKDIVANYAQEIKESHKERQSGVGQGMMGMMGGMMGGGMGGSMR